MASHRLGTALMTALAAAAFFVSGADDPPPAEIITIESTEDGTPRPLTHCGGETRVGRWICLDGVRTHGEPTAFEWSQAQGPQLEIVAAQSARAWVLLRSAGTYAFHLKAKNTKGWCAPVRLAFEVTDTTPALPLDEALRLTGAGEGPSDGTALAGEGWVQMLGTQVELSFDPEKKLTCFRLLKPDLYLFEAQRDGSLERRAFRVPPSKDGLIGDRRPTAVLTLPQDALVDERAELDGSLSSDPDGDVLEAHWHCSDLRHGVALTALPGLKAEFKATRAGVYRVRLVISDGQLTSSYAETFVRVTSAVALTPLDPETTEVELDPLLKPTRLLLYESNLDQAVQRFSSACGVVLRVAPEFSTPDQLRTFPLHLGTEGVPDKLLNEGHRAAPVRLVADWIARQTNAGYRRGQDGSLWLVHPKRCCADERLTNAVESLDALCKEKDASDFMPHLTQAFRGILAERADASILFQPESQKAVAFMPEKACQRMKEIMIELRAPKGMGLPLPSLFYPREVALRRALGDTLVSVDWQHRRVDYALRDLAEKSGVACGFAPQSFGGMNKLPRVTLKLDHVPLRQAVRDLVEAVGFDGCQAQNGDGLWFYKGGEPYPSGELLWDTALVRAYELDRVFRHVPLLNGEALMHYVKRRIYPPSWEDPATACFYHSLTRRLIVVHGEAAHDKIAFFLYDLLTRGEDALGPVTTEP